MPLTTVAVLQSYDGAMTKPRMLVTGGSGYLGGWVTELAGDAWDVTATFSRSPGPKSAADWRKLDVRDSGAVSGLIEDLQPRVIVHTAALNPGQGNAFEAVNVAGTANVANAAAAVGARLVHISTDMVFDGQRGDYTESDTLGPLSEYGRTKAMAEDAVSASGAEAAVVRTSLIYGWRPTIARAAQWMIDAIDAGQPVRLWSDEMRCPVWVESLAAAIVELAEHTHVGPLHVAGDQILSRYEFGTKLLDFHGVATAGVTATTSPPNEVRPLNCTLDTSLARTLLTTPLPGVDAVLGAE